MADLQQTAIVQKMIDAGESEANIATVIQHFAQQAAPAAKPPIDLERRKDSNIIGIDFDWIADHASRLPAALQQPVAAAAAFLGSVLQDASAPENVATLGAGNLGGVSRLRAAAAEPIGPILPAIREPVAKALDVVATAMDNPIAGVISPRAAHAGKIADAAARLVRGGKPAAIVPAGVWKGPPPTLNESLEGVLSELRQPAPAAPAAARLPQYPQAAADSMRLVEARGPIAAREALTRPAAAASTPAQAAPAQLAPVASHTPTPPAAAVRNLNDAPASPVTPAQAAAERVLQFNPSKVLAEVKTTFEKLGETPLLAEATNAMEFMRRGVSAEDAVQKVIAMRTPVSAIEDLAARLGGPKDAVVKARVAARNSSGRWD